MAFEAWRFGVDSQIQPIKIPTGNWKTILENDALGTPYNDSKMLKSRLEKGFFLISFTSFKHGFEKQNSLVWDLFRFVITGNAYIIKMYYDDDGDDRIVIGDFYVARIDDYDDDDTYTDYTELKPILREHLDILIRCCSPVEMEDRFFPFDMVEFG